MQSRTKTEKPVAGKKEKNILYTERKMYSSIEIEGFRLFDHLVLDDLARVNFFFGSNNSGKTSILEAVYAHACGQNFAPFLSQVVLRRRMGKITGYLDMGEQLLSVFRDKSQLPYKFSISARLVGETSSHKITSEFHPSSKLADLDPRALGQTADIISLEPSMSSQLPGYRIQRSGQQIVELPTGQNTISLGKWKTKLNDSSNEIDIKFPSLDFPAMSPFKLGHLNDILEHRDPNSELKVFSHLKRYKIIGEFLEEMQDAFPDVNGIDYIPYPEGLYGVVYANIGDTQVPIYVCGDGMRRWYCILGYMIIHKNALHCIEEIDACFHPEAQRDLSRHLIRYAKKYNNQLFITSHSIEFADNFLEALYGKNGGIAGRDEDPVRIFTIKPSDSGKIEIWKLTGKEAYDNRIQYDLELR